MKGAKTVQVYDINSASPTNRREVPALNWAGPYLCITESLQGDIMNGAPRYAVTHVGSGGCVCRRRTRQAALKVARRLARIPGWSWRSKTEEEARRKTLSMRYREVIVKVISGGVR